MFSNDLKAVTGLDKGILCGFILFASTLMNGCKEPHQIIPTGPPVANAGPDTVVVAGRQFTLDASSSQPFSPGDSLTFKWSMLAKPSTSTARIVKPTGKLASLTPDLEGRYIVQLQVDGPGGFSSMDTVNITAVQTPPDAEAGPDTVVWVGNQFTLDASASQPFSPGDLLTFKWSMLAKPSRSAAGIVEPTGKLASFTPDQEGRYSVQLQVDGPGNFSSRDTVNITAVTCMAGEINVSEYALLYDEDFSSLPSTHWQFTAMDWGEYFPPKVYAENGSLVLYSGTDDYGTFARAELDLSHLDLATKDAVVIRMEIGWVEFPFLSAPNPGTQLIKADEIRLQVLGKEISLKVRKELIQNGHYVIDGPSRLSNAVVTMRITASEFLTGEENPWCTNLSLYSNAQQMEAAKLMLEAYSIWNDIGTDFPVELRIGRIQIWAH